MKTSMAATRLAELARGVSAVIFTGTKNNGAQNLS
jgi:hypothetical protein